MLKPGETVDAHRYHQQLMIKLHRAVREKRLDLLHYTYFINKDMAS